MEAGSRLKMCLVLINKDKRKEEMMMPTSWDRIGMQREGCDGT